MDLSDWGSAEAGPFQEGNMITFMDVEILETDDYELFRRTAECLRRNHIGFQYRMTEIGCPVWHVYVKKKESEEAEYVLRLDHVR